MSKLITLMDCPRNFDCKYIRKVEVKHSVRKVFGSVVHYMCEQFFKIRYKTRDSFVAAGKGYWMGVVHGEHGPSSFSPKVSPPIEIEYGFSEPGMFFGMLINILKNFWDRNTYFRDKYTPLVEKNFVIDLEGIKVRGVVDRVQETPTGSEIWDYKPYTPSPFTLEKDLQMTTYNVWHIEEFGVAPTGLGIYNYMAKGETNPLTVIEPRGDKEIDRLVLLFVEAVEYVHGLITGDFPRPGRPQNLTSFREADMVRRNMQPPFVVSGYRCRGCESAPYCRQIESGELPTTLEYIKEHYSPVVNKDIGDSINLYPQEEAGRLLRKRLNARLGGEPKKRPGEEKIMELVLDPEKKKENTQPTKYGACSNCGYSLGKNGKCNNCLCWFDSKGKINMKKTLKSQSRRAEKKEKTWKKKQFPELF